MWIEPLALQTWLVNVFAGDANYFTAIAMFFIVGMAAYFRMNGIGMFFMLATFLLLFSGIVVTSDLLTLIAIIGGLIVGYSVSKIVK